MAELPGVMHVGEKQTLYPGFVVLWARVTNPTDAWVYFPQTHMWVAPSFCGAIVPCNVSNSVEIDTSTLPGGTPYTGTNKAAISILLSDNPNWRPTGGSATTIRAS